MTAGPHVAEARDHALRLELLFGKAVLTATDLDLGPWSRLAEFRAEIPGRRYPFDLGTEPERFRRTRAIATALGVDIDGARLKRSVATAARSLANVEDVSVELLEDELRLAIEPRGDATSRGVVIARFALVPDVTGGAELDLVLFDHLELGPLPEPGPCLIARVLPAVLESAEFSPLVSAFAPRVDRDTLRIPAARLCLSEAFVRRRWKLPGAERLRWTRLSIAPGRASLRAAAPGLDASVGAPRVDGARAQDALASQEARAIGETGEAALFAGDVDGAIRGYRAALERFGAQRFLRCRYLSALLGSDDPMHAHEAEDAARRYLEVDPDDVHALAVRATLAQSRGDLDNALALSGRLADALGRAGRGDDRVDALLFAARAAAGRSSAEASSWIDRALRLAPRSPAVLRQRVQLARATGDADAYEDGISRLLALARSRSTRARLHRELGRLARDRRDDFEAARIHLQQAAELSDGDAATLTELARTQEAAGRHVDAIRAYRDAARALDRDAEAAADAFSAAARIWERQLRDPSNAAVDIASALERAPERADLHAAAVRLAVAARDDDATLRAIDRALAVLDAKSESDRPALVEVLTFGAAFDARRGQAAAADAKRRLLADLAEQPDAAHAGLRGGRAVTLDADEAPVSERAPAAETSDEAAWIAQAPRPAAVGAPPQVESSPAPAPAPRALTPEDRRALEQRLANARESGNPEALVAVLPEVAEAEAIPNRRARVLSELGQLLYYELEAPSRALQYLEEAQRLDPEGVGADYGLLSALESIYEDTASAEGLMTVYRRKLAQASGDEIRNVYRLLMAGVLFEQLGQPREGVVLLDEVLDTDPRSVPALRLRARIWQSMGLREDAASALEALIAMRELDPFERQELLRELGRLEWQSLGRLGRAAERFEELLSEIPGDTDCISSLKQIYGKAEAWDSYLDVLRRELGILAGSPTAFTDLEDAARCDVGSIAEPLRATYGQILAEAAEVVRTRMSAPRRALAVLDRAVAFAPEDVFVHEARLACAEQARDAAAFVDAASKLAPQLLAGEERERLLTRARAAAERAGLRTDLAIALRKAGIDDAEPEQPAEGERPQGPTPTSSSAETKPKSDDATTRLERLDGLAAAGKHAGAVRAIDAWLPAARQPALRRELLVRKGRWLLDGGAEPKSAVLPLKGALILAPDSADTRLELLRASCRLSDVSQANDQLREYLGACADRTPSGDELDRLRAAIDDLTALPSGPDGKWIAAQVRERAAHLLDALGLPAAAGA